eukprot:GILI01007245.1.p1 GENE.GILI01007245.1~~GILI01007245.1.p1  ORF type:complete len:945 (+),score=189.72 GILI01007245.1:317-3151(+)
MSYYGGESPFSPSSPPPSQQGKEGLRGTYGATSPSPSPQAQAAADSASNIAGMRIKKGKLLGKGAFGAVYQAMNVMSGELLAIKQLPIAVDVTAHTLRGIEREIAINSSLPTHVNCVQYLGVQSTQRNIYIVMEHVSGGSIQSLLQSVGQFHEKTMRSYSNMILKGLQHLHKNNVVHQDIKGANVLIDEKGVAKIADFGCSKDLSTSHQGGASSIGGEGGASSTFHNAGTPLWMAPEVCRGENATKSSDIWSFGCLLLEMVTEERSPWVFAPGTSAFAVLYAIGAASRPPQPPQHLSATARDFISKCLMLDPSKRPTVDELLRHPFLTQPSHHTHSPSSSSSVASPNGQQGISLSSHNGASHSPQGVTIQYANGSSSKAQKSEDITMQDWEADWETRHAGFEDVSKSRNANAHLGHEPSSPFLTRGPSGDTIGIGGVIAGGGKGINLRKIYLQQQERQHNNSGPTDTNGSFYVNNGGSKPMVRPRPNATSGGEEPSGRSAEFVLNAVADDDDDDDEGHLNIDGHQNNNNRSGRKDRGGGAHRQNNDDDDDEDEGDPMNLSLSHQRETNSLSGSRRSPQQQPLGGQHHQARSGGADKYMLNRSSGNNNTANPAASRSGGNGNSGSHNPPGSPGHNNNKLKDSKKLLGNSGGHRGGAAADNMSESSMRSTAKKNAKYTLTLSRAITNRRIGILIVNGRDFHRVVSEPNANVTQLHQEVVELVEGSSKAEKGVIDAFHGDHFVITFNAAMAVGAPAKGAALCALRIQNNVRARTALPGVTMGLSAGLAMVGTLGSADMKKFCMLSPAFSQAIALETAAKRVVGIASCLFSMRLAGDLDMHVYSQVVGQKYLCGTNINVTEGKVVNIGGIMGAITTQGDEWLYELEEGASKNPYAKINAAYELFLAKQYDRCVELLSAGYPEKSDAGMVANWERLTEILNTDSNEWQL